MTVKDIITFDPRGGKYRSRNYVEKYNRILEYSG